MQAIGYQTMGSLEQADFIEFTTDIPGLGAHDLLVEVHIRVVREAARRQLGWDMNVRDRSNDYCTDLVGAWAGPRRIMSKSGPYYRPENTNLSESDGLRVRPT